MKGYKYGSLKNVKRRLAYDADDTGDDIFLTSCLVSANNWLDGFLFTHGTCSISDFPICSDMADECCELYALSQASIDSESFQEAYSRGVKSKMQMYRELAEERALQLIAKLQGLCGKDSKNYDLWIETPLSYYTNSSKYTCELIDYDDCCFKPTNNGSLL